MTKFWTCLNRKHLQIKIKCSLSDDSVFDEVENNIGKGENTNAGYPHFIIFPKCFPKQCLSGLC